MRAGISDDRLFAHDHLVAKRPRSLGRAAHRLKPSTNHAGRRAIEAGIARLGCLFDVPLESISQVVLRGVGEKLLHAKRFDEVPRIAIGRRVRDRRPRANHTEIVSDDVRYRETDDGGGRGRCEAATLYGRQMLANRVQSRDVSAALSAARPPQCACLRASGRRQAPPSAPMRPREQHDERVARASAACDIERAPAGSNAALVRQRMARRNPFSWGGSSPDKCVPMTMPSRTRSPAISKNARAMNGAAFPTAITCSLAPCSHDAISGSRTARGIKRCGDAASMAPRAMVRKWSWKNSAAPKSQ